MASVIFPAKKFCSPRRLKASDLTLWITGEDSALRSVKARTLESLPALKVAMILSSSGVYWACPKTGEINTARMPSPPMTDLRRSGADGALCPRCALAGGRGQALVRWGAGPKDGGVIVRASIGEESQPLNSLRLRSQGCFSWSIRPSARSAPVREQCWFCCPVCSIAGSLSQW